ncbi:uncharacterized protein BXZ73DRAFT_86272 [Epithele typhae]|uniref:uncharacterized protein n=1 Tax=Epithele typhae TaxID=378194 RepID=UPI002008D265|nr:uncharacterized protein BXZ73DRAFT_86272 [Epithele typhae]KAH9946075.1 hypothetical protein BXZ73DRAFT_86272 [Epithele typhae]
MPGLLHCADARPRRDRQLDLAWCLRLPSPNVNGDALDRWITAEKRLAFQDTLRPEHLADLYITLPTRDGTRASANARRTNSAATPAHGDPLGYGHHLVFFHPRNPESVLRPDGTDAELCPPEPFTRRMWAAGRMEWKRPLYVGDAVNALSSVDEVTKKGFDSGQHAPMVFVKQRIEYRRLTGNELCVTEERVHVYLAIAGEKRAARKVADLPAPEFQFECIPSPTTLFRFSALTFNGHYIHLDKTYAQQFEGYPERLVHGPLTALMLLETAALRFPNRAFKTFDYRAVNPIVVNQPVRICLGPEEGGRVQAWAEVGVDQPVVGMVGAITLADV